MSFAIGVLGVVGLLVAFPDNTETAFTKMVEQPLLTVVGLAMMTAAIALNAWRWASIVGQITGAKTKSVLLRASKLLYKASLIGTVIPLPILMDAVRVQQSRDCFGGSLELASISVFLDRLYGAASLVILATGAWLTWAGGVPNLVIGVIAASAIWCTLILIGGIYPVSITTEAHTTANADGKAHIVWDFLRRVTEAVVAESKRPAPFLLRTTLSLLIHLLQVTILALLVLEFTSFAISWDQVFAGYIVATGASMASITPGGLAVSEMGFAGVLAFLAGVSDPSSIATLALSYLVFRVIRILSTLPGVHFWMQ